MEALILSCGTGGGHNAAGAAICEELTRRGHHAQMLNPYTLKSQRLADNIDQTYVKIAQRAPGMFGFAYQLGDLYRRLPWRSPVYLVNRKMAPVLARYLADHPADVIIMPHLYPAEIITAMREQGFDTPPSIFVATDYSCIPFTEETQCDAYVIAAKELTQDYLRFGMDAGKLYPLGIPVRSGFSEPLTRQQAKQQLGLDETKQYILLSGGSIGAGKIDLVLYRLLRRFGADSGVHIIMICGSHTRILQQIEKRCGGMVTLIGHTDQMALYMKACSVFIGKPGGLSSTEAVVAGVPLLHTAPIPGCETKNVRFFSDNGLSVNANGKKLLEQTSTALQFGCASNQAIVNVHAATDIWRLAEQLVAKHPAPQVNCAQ